MRIHLLNTSIIPSTSLGVTVEALPCDLATAQALCAHFTPESHVGHESTAQIMSELLGFTVPMDRTPFKLDFPHNTHTLYAMAFQIRGRAPEGVILSREQIEAMGYDFRVLVYRQSDTPPLRLGSQGLRPFAMGKDYYEGAREDEIDERTIGGTLGILGDQLMVATRGDDGAYGPTMKARAL